jgi:hypothetical protein
LRRNDAKWDEMLRQYLFTSKPIVEVEEQAEGNGRPTRRNGVGDLRAEPTR